VKVRADLVDPGQIHANMYATKSSRNEPACRLGIHIEGKEANGNDFSGWLSSEGEKLVKRVNTLTDMLDGKAPQESMCLPGRWVPYPKLGERRGDERSYYTSYNVPPQRMYY
jgi:hypothetical protein